MNDSPPLLVFDLDGTLVDSSRDLVPALNRTTATVGLPAVAMEDMEKIVGHGARVMIERAFALKNRPLDAGTLNKLFDVFLEDYSVTLSENTIFYDGVIESLDRFTGSGWLLAVCTNKFEGLADKLIEDLGHRHRFSALTGGDTFTYRKPDPRHLLETVAAAGGNPARSVMVGDSITDIRAATAARIPVVAVDFGYSDVPVSQLGPDRVISHFDELWDAANGLLEPA